MKRINWEIFFGDSSSEEALCRFAARTSSFKEFSANCSYSRERLTIITTLKQRGYERSIRAAQRALLNRGFKDTMNEWRHYNDI